MEIPYSPIHLHIYIYDEFVICVISRLQLPQIGYTYYLHIYYGYVPCVT